MKHFILLLTILLGGCTIGVAGSKQWHTPDAPRLVTPSDVTGLISLPPPHRRPVVAVYEFPDLTGQRNEGGATSSLSTAVTQGGTAILIDALKNAGGGTWFTVVERNRIDNLAKERQIVRQQRDEYEGDNATKLQPMLFAGLIVEGGIVGYDTSLMTGGAGARYLGIGGTHQYKKDQVIVSLRAVSTNTGEVILNVQISKTIYSYGNDLSVFKFVDAGTDLVEFETGMTENEANTMAVKMAIEAAVVEMIKQGIERDIWRYK
jgi:curli production assembly/transport component CsgG